MRGLSVRQPWAYAIAHGGKQVENRTWWTTHTGPVAIHAGLTFDRDALDCVARGIGIEPVELRAACACGAYVAVAQLVNVHFAGHLFTPSPGWVIDSRCCCEPWGVDQRYHWELADVRPLAEPIPARGQLGLWQIQDDLAARVRASADLALADGSVGKDASHPRCQDARP